MQGILQRHSGAFCRSPTGQCLRGPEGLLLLLLIQFIGHELRFVEYKLRRLCGLHTAGALAWGHEVLAFERGLVSNGVDERDSALWSTQCGCPCPPRVEEDAPRPFSMVRQGPFQW